MQRAIVAALLLAMMLSTGDALGERAPAPAHHRLEVEIEPVHGRVRVSDRVRLTRAGSPMFRLDPRPTLERVRLDGRTVRVLRRQEAWQVQAEAAAGQELQLDYRLDLPVEPSGEEPFLGRAWGFLPGWSGWLPDLGAGPVTCDLTLEVPAPTIAVATGDLVDEASADGVYRARFTSPHPGEPPTVFAGPYEIDRATAGDVLIRTYFPAEHSGLVPLYLERTADYLDWFEGRVGAYPYRGFSVVAAPVPVGLGFPALTYVSERILPLPFMQTRSLAHEILHGWWGNAVRVDYRRGNWAEGLTTYMADHDLAARARPEAAAAMRLEWLRDYHALPDDLDSALARFRAKGHDPDQIIGYGKAAFVFHMLRRRLGDDRFEAALRGFYARHRYGVAAWSDLAASFEEAAGQDLGTFFSQWLERPGAPRLRLEAATMPRASDGFAVELALGQEPPAYELDVPVLIETAAGAERRLVRMTGTTASATLSTSARPLAVTVDPDHDLFRRLEPDEAPPIVRDVVLDPEALLVVAAPSGPMREVAATLAGRLLAGEPRPVDPGDRRLAVRPLIVIGNGQPLLDVLGQAGAGGRPADLQGRGSARVWTAIRRGGPPVLAVEADDPEALAALLRPLPHYRRDSWLIFDGSRLVDRGVWPGGTGALRRVLD
jgi:aminopeptidase N